MHLEAVDVHEMSPVLPSDLHATGSKMAKGGTDLLKVAPWRLTSHDLVGREELHDVMCGLGITPEVINIPDALYQIETAAAIELSELMELNVREEVVGVGPTFARVRHSAVDPEVMSWYTLNLRRCNL